MARVMCDCRKATYLEGSNFYFSPPESDSKLTSPLKLFHLWKPEFSDTLFCCPMCNGKYPAWEGRILCVINISPPLSYSIINFHSFFGQDEVIWRLSIVQLINIGISTPFSLFFLPGIAMRLRDAKVFQINLSWLS